MRAYAGRETESKQKKMTPLLTAAAALTAAFIFAQYLVPSLFLSLFCRDADLKRKYGAEWGLVTGASSGEMQREKGESVRAARGGAALPPCLAVVPAAEGRHRSHPRTPDAYLPNEAPSWTGCQGGRGDWSVQRAPFTWTAVARSRPNPDPLPLPTQLSTSPPSLLLLRHRQVPGPQAGLPGHQRRPGRPGRPPAGGRRRRNRGRLPGCGRAGGRRRPGRAGRAVRRAHRGRDGGYNHPVPVFQCGLHGDGLLRVDVRWVLGGGERER